MAVNNRPSTEFVRFVRKLQDQALTFAGARATTVARLPGGGDAGQRRFVTDAQSNIFGEIVAGGGSTASPVYFDGADWRIG